MSHPFKRYCFFLADKLGKHVHEIMELNSSEISEWMAYDLTNSEKWVKDYNKQQELERQRAMSNQDRALLFKQLFSGKK